MASELDLKYDRKLAEITGPEGRIRVGRDGDGRAIVENLPATLAGLFKFFCDLHRDTEAVVSGDERLSFGDLDRWSDDVAHGLIARGVAKGDRVGIAMRNCPAWIVGYMGAVKAGAVATLINSWWEKFELDQALRLVTPKLVLADSARSERIREAGSPADLLELAIDQPLASALSPLLGAGPQYLPEIAPEDVSSILFTSGSTSEPKGALSTHLAVTTGTYTYSTATLVVLGISQDEGNPPGPPRTLINVPLFHVTGEVPVMLNSFVIGRCMVLMRKWDAGEALRLIERERITYFVGVPTMSLELMNHPDHSKYDLSLLTDIAAGGAPRPVEHVRRLEREFPGASPAIGYGLTETNAVGCSNLRDNYAAKPASTGRPQKPFVEIAILGADDRHLPTGETGEIAIRSAANIAGYWRNPDATAEAFTADGYIRTGDIGYLDEDEYLFIVDRKKEIIIRGGENISTAEVEAACYACDTVAEASVFGAPDERLGEVPVAVVRFGEGADASVADLREFLEQRLAHFKLPDRIIVADEPLPRLGTGKFDRRALKSRYCS
jgi:acyl-CoA synthetase (AMP-forming)/AMP-acid ligase II